MHWNCRCPAINMAKAFVRTALADFFEAQD